MVVYKSNIRFTNKCSCMVLRWYKLVINTKINYSFLTIYNNLILLREKRRKSKLIINL